MRICNNKIKTENVLAYFNYHATARRLIEQGKLIEYRFVERHNNISPALLLCFDDEVHRVMPIREDRWEEYILLIKEISGNDM